MVENSEKKMGTKMESDLSGLAAREVGKTPAGGMVGDKPLLDDSGDSKSRLWRLTYCVLGWHAVMIPLAVGFELIQISAMFSYLQWLIPLQIGLFGGIKATQKILGAKIAK